MERGNALGRKIDSWIEVQHSYMPLVAPHRRRRDESEGEEDPTHARPLFLPSEICTIMTCPRRLVRFEFNLRKAQAEATLADLRGALLHRSKLIQSKAKYASGTVHITRSNRLIQDVYNRVRKIGKKYRVIHQALSALGKVLKDDGWEGKYPQLLDSDIQGPTSLDVDQFGDGKKKLTWIWKVKGAGKVGPVTKETDVDEATQLGMSLAVLMAFLLFSHRAKSSSCRMVPYTRSIPPVGGRMSSPLRRDAARCCVFRVGRGTMGGTRESSSPNAGV